MSKKGRKCKVSKESHTSHFLESEFGATSSPNNSLFNNNEFNEYMNLTDKIATDTKNKMRMKMEGHITLVTGKIAMLKIKMGPQLKNVFEYWTTQKVDSIEANSGLSEQETGKGTLSALTNGSTRASRTRLRKSQHEENVRRSISAPPSAATSLVRDKEGFVMPTTGMITRASKNKSFSSNSFETPISKKLWRNIAVVTPGPNANDPISILRRPLPGETAISLSGSPLLVSSDVASSMPNITLPIQKDKVVSIFPREGFNPEVFPQLDNNTREQLTVLKEYLEAIVRI